MLNLFLDSKSLRKIKFKISDLNKPGQFGYGKGAGPRSSTVTGMTQNVGSDKKQPSSGSWDYKEVMRELERQSSKKRIDIQVGDRIKKQLYYGFKFPLSQFVKFTGMQLSHQSDREKLLLYFYQLQKVDPIVKDYRTNYNGSRDFSQLVDQLNWENQEQYIELIDEFLNGSSNFLNFKERYQSIVRVGKKLESNSISLKINYQALGFSNHILILIQLFDSYQIDSRISPKVFKSWVRTLLFEMKNHYSSN
uniref:Uncharacterized protein n=1 Tax=Seminavis robusta TaxID=568900 RepID=A0A3S8PZI5_9STRA|nr:hypothetical protein [Seminavis robusta]|eukprot:Sro51_chlor_g029350.1 ORF-249 (250) ;mRNA; f:4325-5074